jgi:glycine/D-amino acid oxidase-like deaminating enzyme
MKNLSFWEKEILDQAFDLIVIGAGIVGLSSAYFYKRQHPNDRVLVLEKGAIPEGASTRNAGFACFGSVTELMADMQKDTEGNIKKRILRRYKGLQLLRETLGDQPIGYKHCGGYEIFSNLESFKEAESYIPVLNDWFLELTAEKEAFEPMALNGHHAIHSRLEGALHPGKMMQALIHKVQSSGVEIKWNSQVMETESSGKVQLKNGRILESGQILIACNGFAGELVGEIEIKPGRGLVLVSEPWPDNPWKGIFHYDRGFVYFRNIGTRLLLGGGRNRAAEEEQTDRFGTNGEVKKYLLEFAADQLDFANHLSFEHEWSGIMGFTPTKNPMVERLDQIRVIAGGLSGMGIAIGMDVARRAVEIINR